MTAEHKTPPASVVVYTLDAVETREQAREGQRDKEAYAGCQPSSEGPDADRQGCQPPHEEPLVPTPSPPHTHP